MEKDLEPSNCIKAVPIFKNLSDSELNEIIFISRHRLYHKGDFIYQAGDQLKSLFVIHQGKIKITRYSDEGKEQVIRILSSGEFLGELALFNDALVSTYAEAIEPTIICLVDNKRLKNLMSKSPTISYKMLNELSNRLEKAEALIEHNNLYSALAKVAKYLLDLEVNHLAKLPSTKVNLASQLGITPETLSRKLKELEQKRLIEVIDNRTLKINNRYELEVIVNPDQL